MPVGVSQVAGLFNGTSGSAVTQQRRVDLAGVAAPSRGAELEVHALRLLENTDRFSSDMRAVERGACVRSEGLMGLMGLMRLMRLMRLMGVVRGGRRGTYVVASLSAALETFRFPPKKGVRLAIGGIRPG